jgi:lysophospholipase L1-like esterase
MWYVLAVVLGILVLDVIRACFEMRRASKIFKSHYAKKKKLGVEKFGRGPAFHLVIMGDSTFDVRGDTEVPYGPAQAFVNEAARHYTVHVHLLAQAGAKTYEVIASQLPKLKALPKVDLVVIYMGANNALFFKSPFTVDKDYRALLAFTESRGMPVAASQLGNYWTMDLFPWVQRAYLYFAVHVENARIRRAFVGTKHASLFALKPAHKAIHKRRRKEPYLLDGLHPNDSANMVLGNNMLEASMKHPAIAACLKKKT